MRRALSPFSPLVLSSSSTANRSGQLLEGEIGTPDQNEGRGRKWARTTWARVTGRRDLSSLAGCLKAMPIVEESHLSKLTHAPHTSVSRGVLPSLRSRSSYRRLHSPLHISARGSCSSLVADEKKIGWPRASFPDATTAACRVQNFVETLGSPNAKTNAFSTVSGA
ncbi:hypothetical protein BDD12DRAFT_339012 [Trichophaea hybrida]|nr:hypothetical protein BDD12DRAFT_339012 [Trichophaea hybrida]